MEKIKNFFKKLGTYYRKKRLYKTAQTDAAIMCGRCFHILPAELYIKGDKELMLKETQRIMREYKQAQDDWFLNEWPVYDDDEENRNIMNEEIVEDEAGLGKLWWLRREE